MDQDTLTQSFLIAMPGLVDPNFHRGVVLVCQHNDENTLGLVINRPSDYTMGDILAQLGLQCRDQATGSAPVLNGGPVQPERGFVLHTPGGDWDSSIELNPQLALTTSRDILQAIADGEGPERFIMTLGYSGWSPGQLEAELRDNAWLNGPADSDIIFEVPLERRWEQAVNNLGIDLGKLSNTGGHA